MLRPLKFLVPFVSALVMISVFSMAVLADGDDEKTRTGWMFIDGYYYYYDDSGEMVTNWQKIDGKWYYFYSSGRLAKDTKIGDFSVNSKGEAESLRDSNDNFDWELSPGGELVISRR